MRLWHALVVAAVCSRVEAFVAPAVPAWGSSHGTRDGVQPAAATPAGAATADAEFTIDGKPVGGPLTPVSNSILVKVPDASRTSLGGIILTSGSMERPTEGEVVAMGPGKMHPETGVTLPMPCEVGDKVLYGKYDGTAVDYNSEDHQFIRDDNILFVYSGDTMTPDTIKMIGDQILVDPDESATQTSGGILLRAGEGTDETAPAATTGKVVAAGPGRTSSAGELVPMSVKVGDYVKFRGFGAEDITLSGVEYKVLKVEAILAKW